MGVAIREDSAYPCVANVAGMQHTTYEVRFFLFFKEGIHQGAHFREWIRSHGVRFFFFQAMMRKEEITRIMENSKSNQKKAAKLIQKVLRIMSLHGGIG